MGGHFFTPFFTFISTRIFIIKSIPEGSIVGCFVEVARDQYTLHHQLFEGFADLFWGDEGEKLGECLAAIVRPGSSVMEVLVASLILCNPPTDMVKEYCGGYTVFVGVFATKGVCTIFDSAPPSRTKNPGQTGFPVPGILARHTAKASRTGNPA